MRFLTEHIEDGDLLGGGIATFVACETCRTKITADKPGIVLFDGSDTGEGRSRNAMVIHKAMCETEATRNMTGGWQDLDIFLRDIVLNSGVDMAATEDRISGPGGLRQWGLHS